MMRVLPRWPPTIAAVLAGALSLCACAHQQSTLAVSAARSAGRPLIIAHRGASGHRPEHTLASYALAIEMGADFVEPDLVMTSDHVLVARHENEIGGTSDVAQRFPTRRRTRVIDGDSISGWFTEDFTLAELKTLRARERIDTRSHAYDGLYEIPTLDEILLLLRERERATGRTLGVYPETKHPTYFASIGLPLEDSLLATLGRHGFRSRADAVFIQSFEVGNLQLLRQKTTIRLVQLINLGGTPPDLAHRGVATRYAEMIAPAGLRAIARYADAIGAHKALVLVPPTGGAPAVPTTLVADAHAAGLAVHVWTMRSDAPFLGAEYRDHAEAEWTAFAVLGVDGIFGDFPDAGVRALRGSGAVPAARR